MSNDTRLRAYQLFRTVLERPVTERESLIAASAVAEPDVADAAVNMLREYEKEEVTDPGVAVTLPDWAQDREGSVVNGWQVERHIDLGGFGTVYHAWRPVAGGREDAAMKFLDIAPHQIARFLQERQVLVDLNHEGICKFIDAGTTEAGTPFVAMEYVPGLPITRHCDYHRKTVTARLNLFVKLCRAVEYAHEHQVLHRDLKPANILVTAVGAVRILDFGIAKVLDRVRGSADRLTKPGETPWTKAYASPEQLRSGDLSFATDVYALGALLYELVTGQLPFSDFSLAGPDWLRVIEEREPLRPSQALLLGEPGMSSRPAETAPRLRGSSMSRLKRALAGNLDAIILKALNKDPKQRYQRVDRLRLEVERYLEGLPVSARRSSRWERAVTWSSKHRFVASVAVTWSLGMLLLLNFGLLQDIQARAELREQEAAMVHLAYLVHPGLRDIERTLPPGEPGRALRMTTAQIHSKLLKDIEQLPENDRTRLDIDVAESSLDCGQVWQSIGNFGAALEVTTPALERIARRYNSNPRDPHWFMLEADDRRWQYLYARMLRQRVELQRLLDRNADAADTARRLAEVEARP